MLSSAAHESMESTQPETQRPVSRLFLTRKIWLPKSLYDLLPYFYVSAGVLSFLTTIYISEWFWVLPHYVLFSAACIHFGICIYRRRNRKDEIPTSEG